ALLGHTDAVTCLTASSSYRIVVSGSRDRTCIIWDLNKLSFVTQLRGHRAPGDIVSCAGTYIHMWSINGSPISSANTFTGRSPSSRAGASWSMDSGSDDSRRWSDTLSIDEKDGFVFVNYSEGQTKGPQPQPAHPGQGSLPQPLHPPAAEPRTYNQLKAGYRWERQLVFRSKLTMHTAFDRKDNAHPAEITSLSISKCSRFQSEIKRLKISSPVRVCQNCYYNLQHERSVDDGCKN
ncbi:hypothetical protein GOODEAATRI_021116, partial [Goodea atripinnis]